MAYPPSNADLKRFRKLLECYLKDLRCNDNKPIDCISEAPTDGEVYGRVNRAWRKVPGYSVYEDIPHLLSTQPNQRVEDLHFVLDASGDDNITFGKDEKFRQASYILKPDSLNGNVEDYIVFSIPYGSGASQEDTVDLVQDYPVIGTVEGETQKEYNERNQAIIEALIGKQMPDAPADGKEYVRKDSQWQIITEYLSYVDIYKGNQILRYSYYNIPDTYQYYVVVSKYIFDSRISETLVISNVILNPGHSTLNRRDSVVLNIDGSITVEEGIPATNPSTAILDNETQLEIFEVFVTANSTSPVDVNSIIVYDENLREPGGEWDTYSSDLDNIQLENITRPFMGTKSIYFIEPPSGNKATLWTTNPIYIRDYDTLVLNVFPKEPDAEIDVTIYDQSDRYLTKYKIQAGNYGMGEDLHMWYPIVIDITTGFLRQEETQISKIEIELVKNSTNCHVDYILFQGGNQSEIGLQHNHLAGKQGGNPPRDEFYHLSEEDYKKVKNMSDSISPIIITWAELVTLEGKKTGDKFNITDSKAGYPSPMGIVVLLSETTFIWVDEDGFEITIKIEPNVI